MWIEEGESGKNTQELEQLFANNFIKAGGITKRTDEQIASGNIWKDNQGNYFVTERGKFLLKIFNYIKIIFNLK